MLFNMLTGFALLALSGMMFWAGSNAWGAATVRSFIERWFLEGKSLMDQKASHATEVKFLRWPLLVAAVTTVIPFTAVWQDAVIVLVLTALYYVVRILQAIYRFFTHRADREEHELKKAKGEAK